MEPKRFVYILRIVTDPSRPYVGLTHDLPSRLADHNAGRCPHTARYRPWQLHVVIEFSDEQTAVPFERYLSQARDEPSRSGTLDCEVVRTRVLGHVKPSTPRRRAIASTDSDSPSAPSC